MPQKQSLGVHCSLGYKVPIFHMLMCISLFLKILTAVGDDWVIFDTSGWLVDKVSIYSMNGQWKGFNVN